MKIKEKIKPITYMKTNAADILATVSESHTPIIITHNGEAKMVIQDIETYQKIQDALNMMKLIAMGKKSVNDGTIKPARKVFSKLEEKKKMHG